MRDSFFLAWHYLRHHRITTFVLIVSIALILYLPAALQSIVVNAEKHFRARAESTPLVIGPRGSGLELVLGSVYFDKPSSLVMRLGQRTRVENEDLATVVPLNTRYTARDCLLVGTTPDYVLTRKLQIERGRHWEMLGECVLGAEAAKLLDVDVGDKIPVSKSSAFLLRDAPLRLQVVGVCSMTETPDDDVIFTDLQTTWIVEGLGHGHVKNAEHGSAEARLYTDITKDNVGSFHFHGARDTFPITAMLVYPHDQKSETLLLGQYLSPEETAQIVRPEKTMATLLARIVMIRSYLLAGIGLVAFVTLVMIGLVIALTIRLRRSEIVTMSKIGCARHTLAAILGSQIVLVLFVGGSLAAALVLVTHLYGENIIRALVM